MSATIDQRVVEMRFDNKQFEKNIATTMSTLDRFKEKLRLKGATTGLENVGAAAKKVDMSGLGSAVETVRTKFSALEVMGVTALANITNSAVNAGKRMAAALTIDPVKTGLNEYETKMNAIQVLKVNTRDKNDMDDIVKALDDLNEYADNTIYNFAQMTSNMGKFSAQGFDVFESANAIKGLANLAAASGATAEDMSRATYQMSQAMGSSIKLTDWNSLRNANMSTQDLKNTLIALAKTHGIAIDQMIEEEGNFEYTLQRGWLSGEMFTEAMNIYSGVYSDAELAAKGFSESQIGYFKELANDAESAATEVKTFTQLWDVLKETAQSGWTQTWEILFGDFESAKETFTQLQKYFSGVINAFSEARNVLLGGAFNLSKPWEAISNKLNESGLGKIADVAETVASATDKLKEFQDIVSKVWRGDFGNSDTGRYEKLASLGYDHRVIQELVNKGVDYKITVEDVEEAHKKFGLTLDKTSESTKKATEAFDSISDEKLKDAGLTESEIRLYRALEKEAARTGTTIEDVVNKMSERDGRTLIIESFTNAWKGFVSVLQSMRSAWQATFDPITSVEIYRVIESLNKMSGKISSFLTDEDTVDKLTKTFKGLFAALDVVLTVVGGPLKIAFKIFTQLLGAFNLDILDVTAGMGDAIVNFRDWIDGALDFSGAFDKIAPKVMEAYESIREWISGLKDAKDLPKAIADGIMKGLTVAFGTISNLFAKLREGLSNGLEGVPGDFISGFVNGIKSGITTAIQVIIELGKQILDKFCEVMGIQSPSWKAFNYARDFILGFWNGIKEFAAKAWDAVKEFGEGCIDVIKKIDFGKVFSMLVTGGMTVAVIKIAKAVENFSEPFGEIGNVLDTVGDTIKQFRKTIKSLGKAVSFNLKMQALKALAIAIAILVASLIALTFFDPVKLWESVAIIAALALVMGALAGLVGQIGNSKPIEVAKIGLAILGIAAAIFIMAGAAKLLSSMGLGEDVKNWAPILALAALAGIMAGIFAVFGTLVKGKAAQNIDKAGKMMIKMSIALLLMVGVAKLISMMKEEDLKQGTKYMLAFGGIIAGMLLVTRFAGNKVGKVGGTILKISIAMLLLVGVAKLISMMKPEDLQAGIDGIAKFGALIMVLMAATRFAGGNNVDAIGGTILKISIAMLLLVGVAKILATMDWGELKRAGVGLFGLGLIIAGLVAATRLAGGNDLKGVGVTLIMMSVAIAILAGVAVVLGMISPENLENGITAVAMLAAMMAIVTMSTKFAQNCVGTLIVITVAIAVLAGAVAGLSFIDPESLKGATTAVGVILGMLAFVLAASGQANGSIGVLIVLTAAIAVLAGAVFLLATMTDTQKAIEAAAALSLLLFTMSVALAIVSKTTGKLKDSIGGVVLLTVMTVLLYGFVGALAIMQNIENAVQNAIVLGGLMALLTILLLPLTLVGKFANNAIAGLIALTVMMAPLFLAVAALALMSNIQNAVQNATALAILMTAMTVLLIPLTLVGALMTTGLPIAGIIGLTLMVVPMFAFIAVLATMNKIQNAQENVELLVGLMKTMTDILVVLAGVGPMALIGVVALTALTVLIIGIGALAIGVGALMTEFPQLEEFIDKGIPVLERLALGLGNMIANFMGGLLSTLPEMGASLSGFMINATPFILGAKLVDTSVLEGVGILAAAIIALTAADLITGIASFIQGGSSFASLGAELSLFMINAMPFVMGTKMLNADVLTGVKALAEAVLILTATDILDGLTSWLTGGSSLADFGAQLPQLGSDLADFAANIGTFNEDQVATVGCAASAIKTLAEAAQGIPNDGGWMGKIFGENNLGDFAANFGTLGTNLASFATNIGTFGEDQVKTVGYAAQAISEIAKAAKDVPNEGGWFGKLFGDNSIATFGGYLPDLGTNLSSFATNLGEFSEGQVTTVGCAANAISAMASAAKDIPNEGGWFAKLFGDNSIATFGGYLPDLGTNLAGFVANLGTFSGDQVNTVKSAVSAINSFAALGQADISTLSSKVDKFGSKLTDFADDLKSFCSKLSGEENISTAVNNMKTIISSLNTISKGDVDTVASFGEALKELADGAVQDFVDEFTSKSVKKDLIAAGEDLIDSVIDGMESKEGDVETAASDISSAAISKLKTETIYEKYVSAGSYVVSGFASGITDNTFKAEAAAAAMASAALSAAEEELDENSPSKEMYRIGKFGGMGFVNALVDYADLAYTAGSRVANSAKTGLNDAIGRAMELFNFDADTQPTITPVLDLSNVRAGANALSNMLDMNPSLGVVSNARAISSMMSQQNQNGSNDDVISAIKDLGKGIESMPRESYNINGINYSGDAEVEDAIRVLVRAVTMEGRV